MSDLLYTGCTSLPGDYSSESDDPPERRDYGPSEDALLLIGFLQENGDTAASEVGKHFGWGYQRMRQALRRATFHSSIWESKSGRETTLGVLCQR